MAVAVWEQCNKAVKSPGAVTFGIQWCFKGRLRVNTYFPPYFPRVRDIRQSPLFPSRKERPCARWLSAHLCISMISALGGWKKGDESVAEQKQRIYPLFSLEKIRSTQSQRISITLKASNIKRYTLLLSRVTSASGVSHISSGNPSSTFTPRSLRPLRVLNVTLSSEKFKLICLTYYNSVFECNG